MRKSQAEETVGAKILGYGNKLGEFRTKRPVWLENRMGLGGKVIRNEI